MTTGAAGSAGRVIFTEGELAYIAAIGPRSSLATIAPPATGPLAIGIAS